MFEPYQLRQRQGLPLESKVRLSMMRIKAWYDHWDFDNVAVQDNGTDAARVLVQLCRDLYPQCTIIRSAKRTWGFRAIVPFMVSRSRSRALDWLRYGCNSFGAEEPLCRPLSVWLPRDIDAYLKQVSQPSAT